MGLRFVVDDEPISKRTASLCSYVGVELAQSMRRFGSNVSLIDCSQQLMSKEDEDVCNFVRNLLEDEGIDVLPGAQVKRVSGITGDLVSVFVTQKGAQLVLNGSHLLVVAGRTPNTDRLGLELAGVELTGRGYIKVNERL
ncbi:MAG: FAD-dependent oxidoreductase [Terracidiphilus sp.]|jgi:pyruvate/2-oxoglutarate dehydrogenase complex dihydrolipoamide dehydrogenase (E3) component